MSRHAPLRLRRWAATVLVAAVAGLSLPATAGGSVAGTALDPAGAAGSLADCTARTGRLAVVLLVDESASLRRTDPADRRVGAIQAALYGLAGVVERSRGGQRPVSVEVALVGFGVDATTRVGWTALDASSVGGLVTASAQFADRDDQIDTDYAAALLAARDELARVTDPADPAGACTAVLWFTDGEYDIEPRGTGETKPYAPGIPITGADAATALEDHGRRLLCDDGGLVDAFRSTDTQILAVALSTTIPPGDRDFMRALAEGEAAGVRCGAPRPPGSPPPGAFLQTEDVSELVARFHELVNDLAGGTALPGGGDLPVCPAESCERGTRTFRLDPGIRSFNLLAVTSAPGIEVELRSPEPGAAVLVLAADRPTGEAPVGSAIATWTWVAADSVLVDVRLPADDGPFHGEWKVTFIDRTGAAPDAVADARIYVFGDLEPVLAPTEFRAGEANELRVGVRHREGTPVDEDLFAAVDVDAVVVDPSDGSRWPVTLGEPDDEGVRTGTWEAPAPDFPAVVNVSLTARVTTESGQALSPVTRSVAVAVRPPSSYPAVTPAEIRFGTVTGVETEEAVLQVRGDESSGGCVWVEANRIVQSPADAGSVTLDAEPAATDRASCLRVAPGEQRELRLRLTPTAAADGAGSGTVVVALISDANPDLVRSELAWRATFERPVDVARAVWLSGLLMAAGVGLPLVLMWLLNWLTARFSRPGELKVAGLDVVVTSTGMVMRRDRPASGLAVAVSDFRGVDVDGNPRSFRVGPLELRARTPWSPFAAPHGEVRADGAAVGSLPPAATGRTTDVAPVPFGLAGTAIVTVAPDVLDRAAGDGRSDPAVGDGRRGDLEVGLWLFAPVDGLSRYATHFDAHRSAVVAVVDALVRAHRQDRHRQPQLSASRDEPSQESTGSPGPPGRTGAPGRVEVAPPGPPGRTRTSGAGDLSRPGRTSSANPPGDTGGGTDPFGPPPGRTR